MKPEPSARRVFHAAPADRTGICGLWIGGMQCEMPGHHQCAEPKGHEGPDKCGGCAYEQARPSKKRPPVDPEPEAEEEDVEEEALVAAPQRTLEAFA